MIIGIALLVFHNPLPLHQNLKIHRNLTILLENVKLMAITGIVHRVFQSQLRRLYQYLARPLARCQPQVLQVGALLTETIGIVLLVCQSQLHSLKKTKTKE